MDKYYTRSNGERIKIISMPTDHILNALGKKQREIFNSTSKDEVSKYIDEINDLKEEYYKRLNDFSDKLN